LDRMNSEFDLPEEEYDKYRWVEDFYDLPEEEQKKLKEEREKQKQEDWLPF
jgi:predicted solute-binding protein